MSNTRENQIENYLKLKTEHYGGLCLKFKSSYAGVPDRIVIFNGKVAFVELKRPKGGRLSPLQRYWAKELTRLGCIYALIKNKQEVDDFLLTMNPG